MRKVRDISLQNVGFVGFRDSFKGFLLQLGECDLGIYLNLPTWIVIDEDSKSVWILSFNELAKTVVAIGRLVSGKMLEVELVTK